MDSDLIINHFYWSILQKYKIFVYLQTCNAVFMFVQLLLLFLSGQTGSGKTFTMLGTLEYVYNNSLEKNCIQIV